MSSVLWDGPELAERYDRISDMQFRGGQKLAGMMNVREGDAVLDVGCGTGRLAAWMAEAVGDRGSVTGIDPSPHRIRIAEEKRQRLGLRNLRFQIGKGEDLGRFAGGAFDRVCYSSVFHWIGDKPAALREAYRTLKGGGRTGMNTVDRDHHFAMKQAMDDVIARKYPEYEGIEDAMSRQLVNLRELEELLAAAGFMDARVEVVKEKHCYGSPKELFDFIEASSFGNFMRGVPDRAKSDILGDLAAELEKRRTADGIELEAEMLYAVAEKPG